MDPNADTTSWFQWVMGGVGTILTIVLGVTWRRQDGFDLKVDALEQKVDDHRLEDERQFAKKDDMRHLYEILTRELSEIKDTQDRNLQRVVDKIDQLIRGK